MRKKRKQSDLAVSRSQTSPDAGPCLVTSVRAGNWFLHDCRAIHGTPRVRYFPFRVGKISKPWMGGAWLRLWEEKPRPPVLFL